MDVFDLFTTTDYTFLKLVSTSGGNTITQEYPANGILKLRDGMLQVDNMEAYDSSPSLHVRPTESFASELDGNLVGHGIRIQKGNREPTEFRIVGQVEGYDFDLGTLEFYRVTLKAEELAPWPSDLPLE